MPLAAESAWGSDEPTVAGITANACTGKPKKHIVKKCYRGPVMVPLRCGNDRWGYKHLVKSGRWSGSFDKKISQTVWSGTLTSNRPGERIYERKFAGCPPRTLFKVITNPGAYSADRRIKPQGVITAYKPSSLAASC
ncbi:hypothetical protein AT728_29320 [Streptomyces silvensis]|uniref:Uncharacterized protein n=1 Tax=Streptomyces silvensis TaxID=1765722 RepID=A0A0W7WVW4_9ACTN|nr:hypothetical protein AT728_29320 [Streptomyces silvensis]